MTDLQKDELVRDGLLLRLRTKIDEEWADTTWDDVAADAEACYWDILHNTELPASQFIAQLIRTVAIVVADNVH